MTGNHGIVASGHAETSRAAAEVLRAGGNAFDAALAALCAACVAEPMMVSLGGGGFLLALDASGHARVYDFFCQTPRSRRPSAEVQFFPILADFGADRQEFHIGMASVAVPGVVAGLFEAHRDLGRIPLSEVFAPAIDLCRGGVRVTALGRYIADIIAAILRSDPDALRLFESPARPGELAGAGEVLRYPQLAEAFDALRREGPALLYRGDWAERISTDSRERGGHLTRADLAGYRVERRAPVPFRFRGADCLTNSPPSPGGCLIAFALGLLEGWLPHGCRRGGPAHAEALVRAMHAATLARTRHGLSDGADRAAMERLLDARTLAEWRRGLELHTLFSRGTTHISVADAAGNIASLTASNGEGSAYVLPGTGIMLNNMLGEEDLNPRGFEHWLPDRRLASMMSPSILRLGERRIALGSGGSNRIRSAIVQAVSNIAAFGLPLPDAVAAPRLHLENAKLSLESGWGEAVLAAFRRSLPDVHEWPGLNLFFGGVHAVETAPGRRFEGAGDPRREGAVAIA